MTSFFRKLGALLLERLQRWGLRKPVARAHGSGAPKSIISSRAIAAAAEEEPAIRVGGEEELRAFEAPNIQPTEDGCGVEEHAPAHTETSPVNAEHEEYEPRADFPQSASEQTKDRDLKKRYEFTSDAPLLDASSTAGAVGESWWDANGNIEEVVKIEGSSPAAQAQAMNPAAANEAASVADQSDEYVEQEQADLQSPHPLVHATDSEDQILVEDDAPAPSAEDHPAAHVEISPTAQSEEALVEPDEEPSPAETVIEFSAINDAHADDDLLEQKAPHKITSEHVDPETITDEHVVEAPSETCAPEELKDVRWADSTSVARQWASTADVVPSAVVADPGNLVPPAEWDSFSERAEPPPMQNRETFSSATRAAAEEDDYEEDDDPPLNRTAAAQRARVRTPKAPIDHSECSLPVGEAERLPAAYPYWNRIIAARLFNSAAGSTIHLAVSPRLLATILSDSEGENVYPAAAEKRFIQAVQDAYRCAVNSSSGLRVFRRRATDTGVPLCVGFLALSVLAAHKMHVDEASSSSAYYIRLSDLLAAPQRSSGLPEGFQKLEFEALWNFLAAWVSKHTSSTLALPAADAQKRYISYPLSHVPLRQLDLEKLPAFFSWADYSPASLISPERAADDFRRWVDSYGTLSQAGRDALEDSRASAVLAQIRSELRSWDGYVVDAKGSHFMQVEVLLENIKRRSRISLLAPRREGCPEVFRCGEVEFISGDNWYDPVEINPADGNMLTHGFTWPADGKPEWVLRRPPSEIIVLAPNAEYSGLVSRSQLPKDVWCAVLCHERVADRVGGYLAGICDVAPRAIVEGNCPADWRLFLRVRAIRTPGNIPPDLRMLDPATETQLVPQGGLRLGRWSWMQGAAPKLLVEGREGRVVYVNDLPVEVDEEGYLQTGQMLSEAGAYTVRVGFIERVIRIIAPALRRLASETLNGGSGVTRPVVLDPGHWTLIGKRPCDAQHAVNPFNHPSLVQSAFEPVWAIKVNVGRGAHVIQLFPDAVEGDLSNQRTTHAKLWVSSIYEAAIRHAEVESKLTGEGDACLRTWAEYVAVARKLKRQWKRSR